jgi:hypothetical protein
MKEASLYEFCLFFTKNELKISEIGIALKPECADVAVEGLNIVKDLPCSLILLLLRKVQEFKSAQITIVRTRHILVEPNTLFQS